MTNKEAKAIDNRIAEIISRAGDNYNIDGLDEMDALEQACDDVRFLLGLISCTVENALRIVKGLRSY